jgi:CubicO group peptidase (beta-lactamase class C family)
MMKKPAAFLAMVMASIFLNAQSLYFPPTTGNTWETISPQTLNWCSSNIDSLYAYLDTNNTKAFILLIDGKIVLEKYFSSHTQNSLWQWASAGKTITSFMLGIAQQENQLSITDTTSKYLGKGWTNCTPEQEEKITIRHQLTMTSGLDDGVADPFCALDTCLVYKADAGKRWAYHNAPYTQLDGVIENATGMTLNTFTAQKLKTPTGMTGTFAQVGYNNVFFSNARSMARFGLLILNKGNWDGTQIMTDTGYYNQMVNTSQSLNPAYGYLWWLNGKASYMVPGSQLVFNGFLNPKAPADIFVAMGKDGQFLNVVPSQKMVWVRMGESPDQLPVPFLLNDKIWEYINALECNTSRLNEPNYQNNAVQIFPNPCCDILNIYSDVAIRKVEIYNMQSQLIESEITETKEVSISMNDLPAGLYFAKVDLTNGNSWNGIAIKE